MMAYVEGYSDDCLNIPGVDYGIALEEGKQVVSTIFFSILIFLYGLVNGGT